MIICYHLESEWYSAILLFPMGHREPVSSERTNLMKSSVLFSAWGTPDGCDYDELIVVSVQGRKVYVRYNYFNVSSQRYEIIGVDTLPETAERELPAKVVEFLEKFGQDGFQGETILELNDSRWRRWD